MAHPNEEIVRQCDRAFGEGDKGHPAIPGFFVNNPSFTTHHSSFS